MKFQFNLHFLTLICSPGSVLFSVTVEMSHTHSVCTFLDCRRKQTHRESDHMQTSLSFKPNCSGKSVNKHTIMLHLMFLYRVFYLVLLLLKWISDYMHLLVLLYYISLFYKTLLFMTHENS